MMHVLLESAAPAQARLSHWTSASVVVHGGIIVAALWLTLASPIEPDGPPHAYEMVYRAPLVTPPEVRPTTAVISAPPFGAITIPAVAVPRITFPDFIPSAQSSADFPASRIFGDSRGSSLHPTGSRDPLTSEQVEQVVRPRIDNPSPAYPSQLRSASVEGDVLVRFVVDTLGRVEPRSVEIREATHALFGDAVRNWIQRTRYEPATAAGQRVRQLVEQRVGFTLRR